MGKIFLAIILFASVAAFAGESGYIKNGVTHLVYKDGKKVGEWPKEEKEIRGPARISSGSLTVTFEDDGDTRCYTSWVTEKSVALSCVKK